MKRIIALLLAVLVLQVGFAPPSQAIFGLSQCEKMWSAIDSEEAIGKELWKRYIVAAKSTDQYASPEFWRWGNMAQLLIPLYESDLKLFKLASDNKECFSSKNNADIRTQTQNTRDWVTTMKGIVRNSRSNPNKVMYQTKAKWVALYPKYEKLRDIYKV